MKSCKLSQSMASQQSMQKLIFAHLSAWPLGMILSEREPIMQQKPGRSCIGAMHCGVTWLLNMSMQFCAVQLAAGQPLWQLLMEPYRTLWLSWEDGKGSNPGAEAQEQQAAANARSAFIASIVAAARAARGRAQAAAQSTKVQDQNGVGDREPTRQEQRHAERDRREAEGESRAMLERLRDFEASQEGRGYACALPRLDTLLHPAAAPAASA